MVTGLFNVWVMVDATIDAIGLPMYSFTHMLVGSKRGFIISIKIFSEVMVARTPSAKFIVPKRISDTAVSRSVAV